MFKTRSNALPGQGTEEGRRSFIQGTLLRVGLPVVKDWKTGGKAVVARVNHGRWIADCGVCNGAEFVDPGWLVFVCCSCGDGPRPVAFPEFRQAIEAELVRRPVELNRNWTPGESAADLCRENGERGID